MTTELPRRDFLVRSFAIAGGFALGVHPAMEAQAATPLTEPAAGDALPLGDWVRITRDDVVTIVVSQAEMGQGISTTLPAILADELGADWERVRLERAPVAPAYRNPRIGFQFTGNSESIQSFAALMRVAGANARAMLVGAAAARWGVPSGECTTEQGMVVHPPSGRRLSFGALAEAAAAIVPERPVALRADATLRLAGRALPRVDGPPKADGRAIFGIDWLPQGAGDVLHAAVRSGDAWDARPVEVDRAAILAREGVVDVVVLPTSVVVVARRWWQARAALDSARIVFDAGPHAGIDSASLASRARAALDDGPFVTVADRRRPAGPAASVAQHTATYALPYQTHAPLEPMNAIARVTPDGVDVWAPTQGPELARLAVAGALGVAPDRVRVHGAPFLGGGFGRRLLPDFCVEAALVARAVGRTVKVIWSREEDMRRAWYRPATLQRISARLDARGFPVSIVQRHVSPTILKPVFPPLDLSRGVDPSSIEGTVDTPYAIPEWRTDFHLLAGRVPTSVYRTTGYGPSLFGLESFVDELARRAGRDPYAYRRVMLAANPRALRVLDAAARAADWNRPRRRGEGRGIALVEAFGTLLAQVVEVTTTGDRVRIDRVVSAVDPGRVFDPEIARAGIEGGVIFGLSSVVKQEITFRAGGPVQRNFGEYDFVRMREAPVQHTVFLASPEARIGGIGEVGPVAVVPAFANAVAAATGRRLRTMPLARSGLALA